MAIRNEVHCDLCNRGSDVKDADEWERKRVALAILIEPATLIDGVYLTLRADVEHVCAECLSRCQKILRRTIEEMTTLGNHTMRVQHYEGTLQTPVKDKE